MPNGFQGGGNVCFCPVQVKNHWAQKEDRSTRSKSLSSKMLTEKVATQSDTCDIAASDAEDGTLPR